MYPKEVYTLTELSVEVFHNQCEVTLKGQSKWQLAVKERVARNCISLHSKNNFTLLILPPPVSR